jgi:hypothetical protein
MRITFRLAIDKTLRNHYGYFKVLELGGGGQPITFSRNAAGCFF